MNDRSLPLIADYGRLIVEALQAVLDAVKEEKEARMSGEYLEGATWQAEEAIGRLAAHLEDAQRPRAPMIPTVKRGY